MKCYRLTFLLAGGISYGCSDNAGGAGTLYDAVPRSLYISNHNRSTITNTLLMDFPNQPLWTNVYVRNHAKASVPLLWSRVQVSYRKLQRLVMSSLFTNTPDLFLKQEIEYCLR